MILKLFLRPFPGKKHSGLAFWVMVLEDRFQMENLTRYLEARKTEGPANYAIEILERPALPKIPIPFQFLGLSLFLGGYFLLCHGMPMLIAVLGGRHSDSGGNKLSPEAAAKIGHFVHSHFSSKAELDHFFLGLGLALTAAGAALIFSGRCVMNKALRESDALTPTSRCGSLKDTHDSCRGGL